MILTLYKVYVVKREIFHAMHIYVKKNVFAVCGLSHIQD